MMSVGPVSLLPPVNVSGAGVEGDLDLCGLHLSPPGKSCDDSLDDAHWNSACLCPRPGVLSSWRPRRHFQESVHVVIRWEGRELTC